MDAVCFAAGRALKYLAKKFKLKIGEKWGINNEKEFAITTLGNKIDITRSQNYKSLYNNPGPFGDEPNCSIDILDSNGKIKTRRWYDSNKKAYRDVDFTDHGNPKEHLEILHEHTWEYIDEKPKRR